MDIWLKYWLVDRAVRYMCHVCTQQTSNANPLHTIPMYCISDTQPDRLAIYMHIHLRLYRLSDAIDNTSKVIMHDAKDLHNLFEPRLDFITGYTLNEIIIII